VPFNLTNDDHFTGSAAILTCLFVLLGHAGFALYEAGLSRAKNASNAMAMNALVWALAALGFFATGFAFIYGAAWPTVGLDRWLLHPGGWDLLSGKAFFLSGIANDQTAVFVLFFVMLCRVTIAASLPTGAMAERWRFKNFAVTALAMGGVLLPIYGSWVWGGGWIAQLGSRLGWGHGGVDYAGSSVVHMQAGVMALVFAWFLGPRVGKYDARRRPRPILGHHIPMAVLGCLLISLSLLALNILPSLEVQDGQLAVVATNSVLAASAGAVAACVYLMWRYGKPDPTMVCNGLLSGLVAIAASCAFVRPAAAVFIGAAAGIITIGSVSFWENRGIDDPAGVVSVHGVAGLWGLLALGIFADGSFGQTYNGNTTRAVAGLVYGDGRQLLAQCVMAVACVVWSVAAGGLTFGLIARFVGPHRVLPEIESAGLDIAEVGVPAYRELLSPLAASMRNVSEPRPAASPIAAGKNRFSIVIEGIDSATLISVWSGLCQAGSGPPSDEFKTVYPFLTTVTGNRFRFSGGDPATVKESLCRLFEGVLGGRSILAKIES